MHIKYIYWGNDNIENFDDFITYDNDKSYITDKYFQKNYGLFNISNLNKTTNKKVMCTLC